MPWTATTPRPAASRAGQELIRDPYRSNQVIAAALRCSPVTVWYTRQRLEQTGQIPHIPPQARLARPRPVSTAALAIAQGAATPRAVAAAASVTLRTAQAQLARTKPALPDAVAAANAISVTDTTPDPGSRATEALLSNPRRSNYALAEAAGISETTVRRARARLERAGEILAYVTEEREPKGPPGQLPGPLRHPPQIPDFPEPPDFSKGLCTHVPASQARWWTSSETALREAARSICEVCPLLIPCADWSLSLPVTDASIYGGMSQVQRLKAKRDRQAAMQGR